MLFIFYSNPVLVLILSTRFGSVAGQGPNPEFIHFESEPEFIKQAGADLRSASAFYQQNKSVSYPTIAATSATNLLNE